MMVALLLYAYARGIRSSRVIERACVEDVAFRVVAAQQRPDHATIARFIERHETALAGLFGEVLVALRALGAGQGRRHRDRRHQGPGQRQPRRQRRLRAARARDHRRGQGRSTPPRMSSTAIARGDELPEELSTAQGRRGWLREAKRRLEAERDRSPQPVPRSRPKRVKEAKRRLEEELLTEVPRQRRLRALPRAGSDEQRAALGRALAAQSLHPAGHAARGASTPPIRTRASSRGCAGSSRATTPRPSPTSTRSSSPPR